MGAMAPQITSLTIVNSTVYSGADKRKHQSSVSLAYVSGIHRWPVNSPHKGPVTRKMFLFDEVIMNARVCSELWHVETCIIVFECYTRVCGKVIRNQLRYCLRFVPLQHDDVIKWKHFPRYWPFLRGIHRSPVNSPHKGQWCRALMFSLICAWIFG